MTEVAKIHAKRQMTDALRARNGPDTMPIHDTPIGSDVLVWRAHQRTWTGPFRLISMEGETCTIEMPNGHSSFRSTAVKPYNKPDDDDHEHPAHEQHDHQHDLPVPPRRNPARRRQLPARFQNTADVAIYLSEPLPRRGPTFEEPRRRELNGLLERGVFRIMDRADVPTDARIFGSRFVDQIKHEGTEKAFEKSRLVVQAYNDTGKRSILTQAPTIQRASQRMILSLAMTIPGLRLYTRDISQAYTQSTTNLARDVFIHAPEEMDLEPGAVLQVLLPLYGIPEAGTHWFRTYHDHHTTRLRRGSYPQGQVFMQPVRRTDSEPSDPVQRLHDHAIERRDCHLARPTALEDTAVVPRHVHEGPIRRPTR